jgi:hypothetical protein
LLSSVAEMMPSTPSASISFRARAVFIGMSDRFLPVLWLTC